MFVTGKLLIRVFVLCCVLVPQIAFSADVVKAPTHCLVDDAVVPYDSYCKGSDVLIDARSGGAITLEGDAEKIMDAALSFCSQQEFKPDSLAFTQTIARTGGFFSKPDSIVITHCGFSDPKQLTQIGLKQLQIRTISLPPSKVFAAVSAWMEFRQPNGAGYRQIPKIDALRMYQFIVPNFRDFKIVKDSATNTRTTLYRSYSLKTHVPSFKLHIPYTGMLLNVSVDITPTRLKLNTDSEGFWLATPSITKGEEGSDTIVRMRIMRGNKLITEPEIYNKYFKEILDSVFVESIDFEPFTIE